MLERCATSIRAVSAGCLLCSPSSGSSTSWRRTTVTCLTLTSVPMPSGRISVRPSQRKKPPCSVCSSALRSTSTQRTARRRPLKPRPSPTARGPLSRHVRKQTWQAISLATTSIPSIVWVSLPYRRSSTPRGSHSFSSLPRGVRRAKPCLMRSASSTKRPAA